MNEELIDRCYLAADSIQEDWLDHVMSSDYISGKGAAFAILDERSVLHKWASAACHGGLNHISPETKAKVAAIVSLTIPFKILSKYGWDSEEELIEYYRYIANDGPVSHIFVSKDPVMMLERGIILNPKACRGGELLMACIQSRQPWEMAADSPYSIINSYKRFIRKGVKPSLAQIISRALSLSFHPDNVWSISSVTPSQVGAGHSPYRWSVANDWEDWRGIILDTPQRSGKPPYSEGGFNGVFLLFGNQSDMFEAKPSAFNMRLVITLDAIINKWAPTFDTSQKPTFSLVRGGGKKVLVPQDVDGLLSELGDFLVYFQELLIANEVVDIEWKGVSND